MVPITPVKPKANKIPTKPRPKPALSTFASRRIEASPNKQSAAVLFTPYKRAITEQSSPTLRAAAQLATLPQRVVQLGSKTLSDTNGEEELQEGLRQLNFESGSESHPSSQSHSSSSLCSGSQAPGHSKPQKAPDHIKPQKAPVKRRAFATDVWTFFTKVQGQHECVLCQ